MHANAGLHVGVYVSSVRFNTDGTTHNGIYGFGLWDKLFVEKTELPALFGEPTVGRLHRRHGTVITRAQKSRNSAVSARISLLNVAAAPDAQQGVRTKSMATL